MFLAIMMALTGNSLLGQSVSQKPGNFPREVSTGNPEADQKANIEAKNKWIKENPEAYRAMGGNPDEVLHPAKEVGPEKAVAPVYPAFSANEYWQLVSLEAVPVSGMEVSPEQLAAETKYAQQDFPLKTTQLQKGEKGKIRIIADKGKEFRATEALNGSQAEWLFVKEGCASCTKTLFLSVKKEAGKLIYNMNSEDEGAKVFYRFTFTPTTTH